MAKKIILKDLDNIEILPITRGELILDSSGGLAFRSNEFLATQSLPGLMSGEDKTKLDSLEKVTVEDKKVEQVNTTTNSSYRILFSNSADDTTKTEGARKSAKLLFNPSTGALTATALIGKLDWSNLNDVPEDFTPAQHIHNTSEITALTSYSKASSASDLVTTDTLNAALGKLEYKADTAYDWIISVTASDTDEYVNKWSEIVGFLDSIKEGTDILEEFVTLKTAQTITGTKTFNNGDQSPIILSRSSSDLVSVRFDGSSGILGYLGFMGVDQPMYRRVSDNAYLDLLHSGNSYINNGVITINGASITPITSHQSLANYVTLNGNQTISGVKTFSSQQNFTVAQGTAPFTVTSTTTVANLSAALLDGTSKSGLLTGFANVNTEANPNSVSVTVGGTTKYLKVAYSELANKVVCSASTSDQDRPILVTNLSNGVYYTTKVKLNYSTGNVTAPTFTGALKGNADTATTASKLSTVSKTAWGLTYWTDGGVPTSISGDMTGVGNITINATGNKDYFINFLHNSTPTYSWRLGYLGSGSGNVNYFVIDSSKSSGGTWHRVLLLGNEDLNATFSGQVIAPNFVSGDGVNDFSAGTVKLDVLNIPTSNGGTTFGPGSNGQVLKSNGTTVYWANDNNSNSWRAIQVNGTQIAGTGTGTYALNFISGTGITVAGTSGSSSAANSITITNAGVRSIAIGTGSNSSKVAVNTNGTTAYLTIPYATESNSTRYLQCPDTRSTNIVPSSYSAGLSADFKSKSITGLTAAFAGVITFRPYSSASDWTGGPIHNLAFDANGIHHRTASSDTWGSWKTFAYTSDIPIVTNYYWANVAVSSSSNAATKPTFAVATATTQVTTPKVHSTGRLTLNAASTALDLKFANDDTKSVILNGTEFKPFDSANGNLDLGASDARWKGLYAGTGNFAGDVGSTISTGDAVKHAVTNTNGSVELLVHTNRGLYDRTNSKWIIYVPNGTSKVYVPTWANKGGSTTPVYFNASGEPITCTAYSGLLTNLSSSPSTNISVTVGGTTKSVTDAYAKFGVGTYTSGGGEQRPSYIGSGLVRWNMMRATTTYFNSAPYSGYCDWMMMDTYTGSDVPYVTMIGVLKAATPHAYIASGSKGDSSGKWNILTLLDSSNSSISGDGGSTWGSSITVKINGTSKTLTIPSNPNTDSKVSLSETTTSGYRPVILGYTSSSTAGSGMTTSTTNVVYASNKFYAQPSTGNLYATLFNGLLVTPSNLYKSNSTYGINLNNSDIVGVNSIYTQDLADDAGEGIHFYRSSTTWDSLTAKNGVLYFSANRASTDTTLTPVFSALSNSGNNISITIGGLNRKLTIAYATSAGDADTLDGYHAGSFLLRGRMTNPSNGTSYHGAIPYAIALKAAGTPVYTDPEFASGTNSVSVYNNSGNSTVAISRIADNQGSANSSGYILQIVNNGGTSTPGRGGFYQSISARQNAVFAQIFRAKIPTGFSVVNAENSMGSGYTTFWLTDTAGTGKWEWYIRITICGNGGTYSGGGHVYLNGSGAVTWYLAYCNLIDLTKGNYDGLRAKYCEHSSTVTVNNSDANSTYRMVWHSGNTLYGTAGIYCNPSTDCLYAAHYYETSDIAFKTNIRPILNSDNIPVLKSFDWKSDGSHSYGLIALELEAMGYPELVSEGDGYKTVNYSAALSLIVGKMQVKIKELEKEIEILKNKN